MTEKHTPGERIAGRYELERRLGAGGFGHVWLARDAETGRSVAIKILHEQHRGDQLILLRFEREARVISELDHPNVARAIAWSTTDAPAYLVMEYVEGVGLDRVMRDRAKLGRYFSSEEILRLTDQIVAGLAHAHQRGIVHRDLKPGNMLVLPADDLHLKILDFGIAKILEQDAESATTVGRFLGTPYYLSPEQIQSTGGDPRSDVFALGTVLFELLTLHRAWAVDANARPQSLGVDAAYVVSKQDRLDAVARIARGARPRPSLLRPELGAAFDALIARATAIDAKDRFQSVEELAAALRAAIATIAEVPSDDVAAADTIIPGAAPEAHDLTAVMPRDLDSMGESATTTAPRIARRRKRIARPLPPIKKGPIALAVGVLGIAVVALSIGVLQERPATVVMADVEDHPRPAKAVQVRKTEPQPDQVRTPVPVPVPVPVPDQTPARPKRHAPREEPPVAKKNPLRDLELMLTRAKTAPTFEEIHTISEAIANRAQRLCAPEDARLIQNCATGAAMVSDIEGLGVCLEKLRRATAQP